MTPIAADQILGLLPLLRRYARALTGSQKRGDGYVRACLEIVLAEPERVGRLSSKLDLFRAFHEVLHAIDRPGAADDRTESSGQVPRVQHGLAELPTVERQILLLTYLEGFTLDEAAAILGLGVQETHGLLADAKRAVQLESSLPILIIEDEPLIALDLARIVEEMGHVVCGTAARQDQAIELAAVHQPALILADIQLSGEGNGIEAVRDILKRTAVPIIFITGYPERLLTGDSVEPAFVMTKPFEAETVKMFIGQALTVLPPQSRRDRDVA